MYVCLCHAVNERTVRRAVREGARSVTEVGDKTRAGTSCGTCHLHIERIIGEECTATKAAVAAK